MNGKKIRCVKEISDLRRLVEIQSLCYAYFLTEVDFLNMLHRRGCLCIVGESCGIVQGFLVYELHPTHLYIRDLCVHPDARRQGMGKAMIARIVRKLQDGKREWISVPVHEENLPAQIFFRDSKFRAVEIVPDFYSNSSASAYRMEYLKKSLTSAHC